MLYINGIILGVSESISALAHATIGRKLDPTELSAYCEWLGRPLPDGDTPLKLSVGDMLSLLQNFAPGMYEETVSIVKQELSINAWVHGLISSGTYVL